MTMSQTPPKLVRIFDKKYGIWPLPFSEPWSIMSQANPAQTSSKLQVQYSTVSPLRPLSSQIHTAVRMPNYTVSALEQRNFASFQDSYRCNKIHNFHEPLECNTRRRIKSPIIPQRQGAHKAGQNLARFWHQRAWPNANYQSWWFFYLVRSTIRSGSKVWESSLPFRTVYTEGQKCFDILSVRAY